MCKLQFNLCFLSYSFILWVFFFCRTCGLLQLHTSKKSMLKCVCDITKFKWCFCYTCDRKGTLRSHRYAVLISYSPFHSRRFAATVSKPTFRSHHFEINVSQLLFRRFHFAIAISKPTFRSRRFAAAVS